MDKIEIVDQKDKIGKMNRIENVDKMDKIGQN